jgi:hypothetical protein
MLNSATKKLALHLALKPTATMIQAPNPTIETTTRANDQLPWKMKPMNRKMRRIRPASWKLFASVSYGISLDPHVDRLAFNRD